ncbi:terminase [Sporosarcina sp. P18a]|uniref:phage terminase large subunit family protein n=1 Tax=Sporosarcina sp. P18a TaxID=2048259 RepID=UPI000C16557C|nr:phage terminase large subunit family protein [Sporosarcina sp. P18a]PIC81658.1 terminase [Sporosarcina sp. P18a]
MPRKSKVELSPYLRNALRNLRPPENLTVSEWAEKHRVLDSKTSAIPGRWSNDITPYLKDIMDEFNNPETEEIVFVKPTQVGGTEALQNMLGYVVMQDPNPAMIVYPTDDLAESVSENRVQPMMTIVPELKRRFNKQGSNRLELQFDGMYLSLTGANSPASLSSKAIRYLFMDEVDKYPGASKKEADPVRLARERTKTFSNSKIFITSTPTVKNGHIWKAKESADIEKHYKLPCVHCGDFIELKFQQVKWPKEEGMSNADRAEFANYCCQECGCIITDQHKMQMLKYGRWEVVKQKTQFPRKVAYWMNTLYSPFVTFAEIAKEFMATKDDPEAFQNFVNSWLGEAWEDTKLKTNSDMVRERQTDIPEFTVPEWAAFLTGGVDVQETSLYYTIRAWGEYMTSQLVAKGQVSSFTDIERIMNSEFQKENGEKMLVMATGIDSGDQTDEVYDFCSRNSEWAIPVKGVGDGLHHFRISKVNRTSSSAYGMQLILVDGGKYKDMIASRMRKKNGTGSWMVYKDIDDDYSEQVTAEHKINEKRSGRTVQVWVPKTSHADNHYLDCEVYNFAMADVLGIRTLHLLQEELPEQEDVNDQAEGFNNSWLGDVKKWV